MDTNTTTPSEEQTQSTLTESENTPPPQQEKNNRKKILVGAVLGLILLFGGALALTRDSKQETRTETTKKDIPLIRIGEISGPLNHFYPGIENTDIDVQINNQIFEGLVQYEDKTKIVPMLATSWTNPDSSTWVFKLKQNVKFHTGRTLTAKDVKVSLEEIINNHPDLSSIYSGIKTVEVVDDNTVKITTAEPDPILLNRLASLAVYDSQGKPNDAANGTGPYQVKPGSVPTENKLELSAFDNYHGGHVYTRELQFSLADSQENTAKDFKENKVDIAGDFDGTYFNETSLGQFKEYKVLTPSLNLLGMNTLKTGSPLQKVEVRQALQNLIDVPAFNKAQQVQGTVADQLIPQELPGYNPAIKRPQRNVAKAKELLIAAGYPNGVTLELTGSLMPEEGVKELQKQFAEGGVKIVYKDIEDFSAFLDAAYGGQTDLYFLGYSSDVLDGIDFLTFITEQQPGNYKSPELEKIVEQANQTTDPAERLKVLQQGSKVVSDNALVVPLTSVYHNFALKQDYTLVQDNPRAYLGVYFWKVHAR